MVKYVLLRLQHGRPLPAADFRALFGRGLETVFGGALRRLELDGAREKRERFLAGLRFVAPARLREQYIGRLELSVGGKALPLRIKKSSPGERYHATAGRFGLQLLGDPTKLLSDDASFKLGNILRAAFLQAEVKKRKSGVPGIAGEFHRETEKILKQLHRRGQLLEIAARIQEKQ